MKFSILLSLPKSDGSSFENAIEVKETTSVPGVQFEYDWLNENYPGYVLEGRSLKIAHGKPYDVMHITFNGESKTIYFNIKNFFGKL